jgi:uncharacterized protein (DUF305 family)
MRRSPTVVLLVVALAGCRSAAGTAGTSIVQPGAPGQANRTISPAAAADLSKVQATPADVSFMQGMIGHHAQAIEMAALLPSRTSRSDMRMLGLRIDLSQADEIKMMRRWLELRHEEIPSDHAHHEQGARLMPGMLTPEEMGLLTTKSGVDFDRLFLELMIKHHAGALTMVGELFATPGAGQEAEVYAFAADVEADQLMEIERMGALLKELER